MIDQKLAGQDAHRGAARFAAREEQAAVAPAADEKRPAVAAAPPAPGSAPSVSIKKGVPRPSGDFTVAAARESGGARGRLVSILPTGVEANEHPLKPLAETTIGRRDCDITFADDVALAEVHARIIGDAAGYRVRDEGSAQGAFLQPVSGRLVPVGPKSIVRAGRQWLVVSDDIERPAIVHHDATGKRLGRYDLSRAMVVVGRQSPDITIAPDDGSLSRRHLAFVRQDGRLAVKDLGSQNGTFVKMAGEMRLGDGDRLHVGGQILKFVDQKASEEPKDKVTVDTTFIRRQREQASRAAVTAAAAAAPAQPSAAPVTDASVSTPAPATAPSLTIPALGRTIPCKKSQTILEAAEHADIKIDWECREGVCGADPVKILSGGDCLSAVGSSEQDTLESFGLTPGQHRYACMARVSGPVTIEIIKTH